MTLSKKEIVKRLNPKQKPGVEPIIITPLLNFKKQVGSCAIDLRLGKQFLLFNEHVQEAFDPLSHDPEKSVRRFQDEIVIPIGRSIILHPGKLLIASTLEYVSIPLDLECQVEGRSSWARLGLIVANANTIEPGYKGIITLELSNTGKIPIKLYPGTRIAQILFHALTDKCEDLYDMEDKKKYSCCIGPGLSKIYNDTDLDYIGNLRELPLCQSINPYEN